MEVLCLDRPLGREIMDTGVLVTAIFRGYRDEGLDRSSPTGPMRTIKQTFDVRAEPVRLTLVFLLVCAAFSGCGPVASEAEIVGEYRLAFGTMEVRLKVNANHTFVETIRRSSGEEWDGAGTWYWGPLCADFDKLILPRGLISGELLNVLVRGQMAKCEQRRDTCVTDWCLAGERTFGTRRLVVNPGREPQFEFVRR